MRPSLSTAPRAGGSDGVLTDLGFGAKQEVFGGRREADLEPAVRVGGRRESRACITAQHHPRFRLGHP